MSDLDQLVVLLAGAGVIGGLVLLARGVRGYRRSEVVDDVATSRIATLAAGEVRISGKVEAAELTLVSPLQSKTCVYYRAVVTAHEGRSTQTILRDERAVGFRIRDDSGAIRVFPRGAGWDVPPALHVGDGLGGEPPPELDIRSGSTYQMAHPDDAAMVAQLLTVHREPSGLDLVWPGGLGGSMAAARRYDEARIEVGDTVTAIGTAMRFGDLADPLDANLGDTAIGGPLAAADDPAIASDLAAATAAGTLETDPDKAWGNAAIEGFGIGRPVRTPTLDPDANAEPVADAATAAQAHATFDISPDERVLAAAPGQPLLVSLGAPVTAIERGRRTFVVGMLGAVLAIASMLALAIELQGGFGR